MQPQILARQILTVNLVVVFGSFGIMKFTSPLLWIGWIPLWMEGFLNLTRDTWLQVFGTFEFLLAVLLLVPKKEVQKTAVALMSLHLLAVLTQTGLWNDIGIRDVGLLLSTIALLILF